MRLDGTILRSDQRITTLEQELQHTRAQLQHTRQRLDELTGLINRSAAVVFRWRVEPDACSVEYVSENVRQFGYTPEDFTSARLSWHGIIHPEDVPRLQHEVAGYLARGVTSFSRCYRIFTKTGDVRWVEEQTGVVFADAGRLTHYEGLLRDITERKQAEEALQQAYMQVDYQIRARAAELTKVNQALQESEAKFRTITEASPAGIFVVLREYIVFGNDAAAAMTGYLHDEILNLPFWELIHPDYRETMVQYARERLAGRPAPERYEIQFVTRSGENRWGDLSPRVISFGGQPAIMAMIIDITERKRVEEALKSSEKLFTELAKLAPVGIFLGDAHGEVTYVNQRWRDITGWSAGHGMKHHWMAGIHPEDRAYVKHERQKMFHELRECHREYRYLTPEGTLKWISVDVRPWWNVQRAMRGFIGTVLDITDRKEAEARVQQLLRNVEQRAAEMDATIGAIADGIVIYGPDAAILRMNQAAEQMEQMLGYTPETAALPLAARFAELRVVSVDGQPLTHEDHPAWRALQGETIHGMVLAYTLADGQHRWISVSAAPIPAPDGGVLGAVATLSDITYLRALQQRQEDLLHIVSHDLRIPLTVIHGHMEILMEALQQHQFDGELALSTSTIDRNVHRMNTMIQDLVDMARLEGQQFTLQIVPVALQEYLPDLFARLHDILPIHRVILELSPDLPPVQADSSRLEQILLNLLTNAFKYSPEDAPVHLQAYRQQYQVVIAVSDRGYGIAPKDLPHLFERFYRAANGHKAEGIGLGLYITRLLVEAQGGRVWVDSAVGKGSTFLFTLPISPPQR